MPRAPVLGRQHAHAACDQHVFDDVTHFVVIVHHQQSGSLAELCLAGQRGSRVVQTALNREQNFQACAGAKPAFDTQSTTVGQHDAAQGRKAESAAGTLV